MLDPALPEGHLAQAWILWSPAKSFQHAEAIAALEQVLAVQPNLERAHNRMSAICMHVGRLHESRIAHEQAQRSNPKTRSVNLEFSISIAGTSRARRRQARPGFEKDLKPRTRSISTHNLRCMSGDLDFAEQRLAAGLNNSPMSPCSSAFKACCTPGGIKPAPRSSVCAERSIHRVPSATRITPITRSPACMQYRATRTGRWRGWNAASTPVSPVGRSSGSIHISNACVRSPNSHGSSLPLSTSYHCLEDPESVETGRTDDKLYVGNGWRRSRRRYARRAVFKLRQQ